MDSTILSAFIGSSVVCLGWFVNSLLGYFREGRQQRRALRYAAFENGFDLLARLRDQPGLALDWHFRAEVQKVEFLLHASGYQAVRFVWSSFLDDLHSRIGRIEQIREQIDDEISYACDCIVNQADQAYEEHRINQRYEREIEAQEYDISQINQYISSLVEAQKKPWRTFITQLFSRHCKD